MLNCQTLVFLCFLLHGIFTCFNYIIVKKNLKYPLPLQHTLDQLKAVLLFAGGWMVDMSEAEADDPNADVRQEVLVKIRQLCIPEVVSLLHKVLQETNRFDEVRQLIDIVKSEDYQLYKVCVYFNNN